MKIGQSPSWMVPHLSQVAATSFLSNHFVAVLQGEYGFIKSLSVVVQVVVGFVNCFHLSFGRLDEAVKLLDLSVD